MNTTWGEAPYNITSNKSEGSYTGWGSWDDGGRESSAEGGTEHGTASSDGMERRNGSDEGGNRKADVDVGVMVGSGQRCGKERERMGRCLIVGDNSPGLTLKS